MLPEDFSLKYKVGIIEKYTLLVEYTPSVECRPSVDSRSSVGYKSSVALWYFGKHIRLVRGSGSCHFW